MCTRSRERARYPPNPASDRMLVFPVPIGAHAASRDVGFFSVIALNNRAPRIFFDQECNLLAREAH
jgi:hypothetical protein